MEKLEKIKTELKKVKDKVGEKLEKAVFGLTQEEALNATMDDLVLDIDNILDLQFYLKKYNPGVEIKTIKAGGREKLQIDCLPEDLIMPAGFEWNLKNGINNKYNSKKGLYMSAGVELKPLDKEVITDKFDIHYELRRLNPDIDVKLFAMGQVGLSGKMMLAHKISSENCSLILPDNVKIEDLNLPKDFYYDEKNGLTNKHNTSTGAYTCMAVKAESEVLSMVNQTPDLQQVKGKPDFKESSIPNLEPKNIKELAEVLQALNPKRNISIKELGSVQKIEMDCLPEDLHMPDGFEWNSKNGLTNKGNGSKGMYVSAGIELKPLDKDVITNQYDIYYEMRRLNPDADIKLVGLGKVLENKRMMQELGVSGSEDCTLLLPDNVNIDDLNLPKDFEYNDKNGLTNKHNTSSGAYTSMRVQSESESTRFYQPDSLSK